MDARDHVPGLNVLVVEDHRDGADSLAALLELDGHRVRVAYRPSQALRLAADFPPDVVLLDIGLPEMTGYELARHLCAGLPARPVFVAITGYGNLEDASRQAGFDHHFLKPIDPAELLGLLAGYVRTPPEPALAGA